MHILFDKFGQKFKQTGLLVDFVELSLKTALFVCFDRMSGLCY